jgi:hypothetical protein
LRYKLVGSLVGNEITKICPQVSFACVIYAGMFLFMLYYLFAGIQSKTHQFAHCLTSSKRPCNVHNIKSFLNILSFCNVVNARDFVMAKE